MNFIRDNLMYLVIIVVVVVMFSFVFKSPSPQTPTTGNDVQNLPFQLTLDQSKNNVVKLTTDAGEIDIKLFVTETPVATNNFAYLVNKGFYNGLKFHRVMEGFMIQGGDPNGDGTGGPGYQFKDETITKDYTRGIVAYANSGPNTNGSQFFIMHADYPLPKNYVIFGEVVTGLETVDKIATAPVEANTQGEASTPITPVVIQKAELVVK
jgi:cyclophilin family peptidyl-prolyl cis-trans isomerase